MPYGPSVSFGGIKGPRGGTSGSGVGSSSGYPGSSPTTGVGTTIKLPFKKGGKVKKMAKGGSTASKRGDGCATKGKTKGRFV